MYFIDVICFICRRIEKEIVFLARTQGQSCHDVDFLKLL